MTYQSITPRRHQYLQRDYQGNRSECHDILCSYEEDVEKWGRTSKKRMHDHCEGLMKSVANPAMLAVALDNIGRKTVLGDGKEAKCLQWYPWEWLRDVQKRLESREFRRGKYEKFKIPKPGKAGKRTIEVPPIETRLVARNLSNILVPILDPDFYPLSIGWRRGRSLLHGPAAAEKLLEQGLTHWVVCDIRDAFGQIPKNRLLQILKSRLHDSPVMWLIEELIDRNRTKGSPQGLGISPLLMNVYLDHFLDRWWLKQSPEGVMIRYGDDILIACPTRESAIASYAALQQQITTAGFQTKESQDQAVFDLSAGESVEWLGLRVGYTSGMLDLSLTQKSWGKLAIELAATKQKRDKKLETVTDWDAACIGFGWLSQKSVAFDEAEVLVAAEQIRQLSAQCGLDMSGFTDDEAQSAWKTGQQQWQKARSEVGDWIPEVAVAN